MEASMNTYVQPVASHHHYAERLVVRDQNGQFYLWKGTGEAMVAIPDQLASWIMNRPELDLLASPNLWFDVESLPMAVEMYDYDNERSVAD